MAISSRVPWGFEVDVVHRLFPITERSHLHFPNYDTAKVHEAFDAGRSCWLVAVCIAV
jgi:hypothetical protein